MATYTVVVVPACQAQKIDSVKRVWPDLTRAETAESTQGLHSVFKISNTHIRLCGGAFEHDLTVLPVSNKIKWHSYGQVCGSLFWKMVVEIQLV